MINYPFVQYGFTTYTKDKLSQEFLKAGYSHIRSEVVLEPPFEREGELLEVESLVVCGVKWQSSFFTNIVQWTNLWNFIHLLL